MHATAIPNAYSTVSTVTVTVTVPVPVTITITVQLQLQLSAIQNSEKTENLCIL